MAVDLTHLVFTGFDYVWQRQRARLAGVTQEEYLRAPAGAAWTVEQVDGRWVPHPNSDDTPRPVPVPTIAWRMWHIADCLASYVSPHLGEWPLPVAEGEWFGELEPALVAYDVSAAAFRERVVGLGADGLAAPLGPAWGPFAEEPWAALVIHAMDEVAHHGAEIALLRDLYAAREAG